MSLNVVLDYSQVVSNVAIVFIGFTKHSVRIVCKNPRPLHIGLPFVLLSPSPSFYDLLLVCLKL
jgi:hypothetical protein